MNDKGVRRTAPSTPGLLNIAVNKLVYVCVMLHCLNHRVRVAGRIYGSKERYHPVGWEWRVGLWTVRLCITCCQG